jgi:phosphatidyl-myo-inositol dimannoside synthase
MKDMTSNVLFLTLKVFSSTGGIEKVCRIAGKALFEITTEDNSTLQVFSMHDKKSDAIPKYFPSSLFKGFGGRKFSFVLSSFLKGRKSKIVLLSHVNLLIPGYLIKLFSPKTKLVLIAHGIEVWRQLPSWKRWMLNRLDSVIAVSNYTKDKVVQVNGVDSKKIQVLNNCIDPYLERPDADQLPVIRRRYNLADTDTVILTLTRFSNTERYKGYDRVMQAISQLKKKYPDLKYLMVGKYDDACKAEIDELVLALGLEHIVKMTGFVKDDELAAHFSIADLYVMPSIKEGFGIVFIEAMYYGVPVIAGNRDGSVDALLNGELGQLVDPQNEEQIKGAIENVLLHKDQFVPNTTKLIDKFSYSTYKRSLINILTTV